MSASLRDEMIAAGVIQPNGGIPTLACEYYAQGPVSTPVLKLDHIARRRIARELARNEARE